MDEIGALRARILTLEQKLEFLFQTLGLEFEKSSEAQPEIMNYLRNGQKINVIKVYMEQTGAGLKEAKDAVDALERKL